MPLVGAGAVALFIGIAALGPFIARPVCTCSARRWHGLGTSGKLGRQNAMRNPSRTAATAAALMVGVSLVSRTTVMASSVKASVGSSHRLGAAGGLRRKQRRGGRRPRRVQPAVERSLAALPGVADVAGIRAGVSKGVRRG